MKGNHEKKTLNIINISLATHCIIMTYLDLLDSSQEFRRGYGKEQFWELNGCLPACQRDSEVGENSILVLLSARL
jgi:hypothetical protein